MNISPVSFGRTIKVNMDKPFNDTEIFPLLLQLINTPEEKYGDSIEIQKKLKTIFNDTDVANARPVFLVNEDQRTIDGYIVSGEESKKIGEFLDPYFEKIKQISTKHKGHFSSEQDEYFKKFYPSCVERMRQIITETKDKQELKVQYDGFNKKIKLVNLVG